MKFHIRSLGCKMNWLDAARITAQLQLAGHTPVQDEREAELVLVNTCTVTGEADRKSRREAVVAARDFAQVAVFGCGPNVEANAWRAQLPDHAQVFDSEATLLRAFGADPEETPFPVFSRTRLPVAIQTGCDNRCTFCITRTARGVHRSLPADTIVEQVRRAHEAGVQEVVLTGINLGAWGAADSNDAAGTRLPDLLERLMVETEIPRVRISSLGPQYLTDRFFDLFGEERLCDHLHLSVQSGSEAVLAAMDRGHGTAEVMHAAQRARGVRPHVALTADFITGFPGEGEREHAETAELIRAVGFARLHLFPFSPRAGTPAAALTGSVPMQLARERAAELRALGRELRTLYLRGQTGRRVRVLAERGETGLTSNYVRLATPGAAQGSWLELTLGPATLAEGGSEGE